jgi:hypothetical protein
MTSMNGKARTICTALLLPLGRPKEPHGRWLQHHRLDSTQIDKCDKVLYCAGNWSKDDGHVVCE